MSEEFARHVLRVVVAQVCASFGFQSIEQFALETLVDVLQEYIEEIGYTSHSISEVASRTESNFHDVLFAFADLKVSISELMLFATQADEMPFSKPLPEFPMKTKQYKPKMLSDPEEPLPSHIPSFLPAFPDKHTYMKTPVPVEKEVDPVKVREKKNRERHDVEYSLARLHKRVRGETAWQNQPTDYQSLYDPKPDENKTGPDPVDLDALMSKPSVPTPAVRPTPLPKDSPFITAQYNVPVIPPEEKEEDKAQSAAEEVERKKRQERIERILALQHRDGVDTLEVNFGSPYESAVTTPGFFEAGSPISPSYYANSNTGFNEQSNGGMTPGGGNYSPVNSPRPSLFSAVIGSSQNNNNNTPNNPEDNQLMDII
jgi:hypothetical protein